MPELVGFGTASGSTAAPNAHTMPAGIEAGDILLMFVHGSAAATGYNIPGWSLVVGNGTAGPAVNFMAIYWKRAEGPNESPPRVTDLGAQTWVFIAAFRYCKADGTPFRDFSSSADATTPTTACSVPGITVQDETVLVLSCIGHAVDSAAARFAGWANADLVNVQEIRDAGYTDGTGGGIGIATGERYAVGTVGATTATMTGGSTVSYIMLALIGERDEDEDVPSAPYFVSAGAVTASSSDMNVPWPSDTLEDDIGVLLVQTANQAVPTVPEWTQIASSPQGAGVAAAAGSARLTAYWRRANSSAPPPADVDDSGDHQVGVVLVFRGCKQSGDPVNASAGDTDAVGSTGVTVPAGITTKDNALVVAALAHGIDAAGGQASAWANALLSGLAEIVDDGTATGTGGGIAAAAGVMLARGSYGATTATLGSSSLQGRISFALEGEPVSQDDRCMFGYQNFIMASELYTPSLSGGSWNASFPLSNLLLEELAEVARSTNDATASTQFEIDLAVARTCRVFGLIAHNMSLDALVRVRASNVAGSFTLPLYDSGWVEAYGEVYPEGTLQQGHPAYRDRNMTLEDWSDPENRLPFWHVMPSLVHARYWLVEVDDQLNPDGWVEIGYPWLSWAFKSPINFSGADLGWVTTTKRVETDGGPDYYDERGQRREFRFTFSNMEADPALVFMFDELQRKMGISRRMAFIYNPNDTAHLRRRSMLCTHRELSSLAVPLADVHDTIISLREVK